MTWALGADQSGLEEGRLSRLQGALICKLRPVTVCLTSSGGGLKTKFLTTARLAQQGGCWGCVGRAEEGESLGGALCPSATPLISGSESSTSFKLPLTLWSKGPSSASQTREGSGLLSHSHCLVSEVPLEFIGGSVSGASEIPCCSHMVKLVSSDLDLLGQQEDPGSRSG